MSRGNNTSVFPGPQWQAPVLYSTMLRYTSTMPWEIEYTDEFAQWWDTLTAKEQGCNERTSVEHERDV